MVALAILHCRENDIKNDESFIMILNLIHVKLREKRKSESGG